MSNDNNSSMVKLGGLWLGKTKGGKSYMSGNLGASARLLVFKNEFKKDGDNQPDYVLFLAPRQQENAQEQQAQRQDNSIPF